MISESITRVFFTIPSQPSLSSLPLHSLNGEAPRFLPSENLIGNCVSLNNNMIALLLLHALHAAFRVHVI